MINDDAPEGATPLDPDERAGLKLKHVTTRGELDELEQANIQTGLRHCSFRRHGYLREGLLPCEAPASSRQPISWSRDWMSGSGTR